MLMALIRNNLRFWGLDKEDPYKDIFALSSYIGECNEPPEEVIVRKLFEEITFKI